MKKQKLRLKEVCLEITDTCPMDCLHCSGICGLGSRNILPLHQIKRIIDEFSSIGGEILEISGGEPLMHPFLPQIVDYAERNNLETVLYTSGNMLDSKGRIASLNINIAEKLQQSGVKKVIFNLQGKFPSTHEYVTQVKGSFGNVINGIKTMKSLGFWVGTHFVPMKPNYREFRGFLQLCHDLGVDEIGVLRFVPQGRGQVNRALLELSQEEYREFISNLTELTSHHKNPNIRVGRPIDFRHLFDPSIVKPMCDAGISRCLITPKGKVVPCPAFKQNNQYIAGDVKNSSLVDIWNKSPIWRELRYFDYTQIDEPCRSCEYLHQCIGGCNAQRILKYRGNIHAAPDPACFRFTIPVAVIGSSNTKIQE